MVSHIAILLITANSIKKIFFVGSRNKAIEYSASRILITSEFLVSQFVFTILQQFLGVYNAYSRLQVPISKLLQIDLSVDNYRTIMNCKL